MVCVERLFPSRCGVAVSCVGVQCGELLRPSWVERMVPCVPLCAFGWGGLGPADVGYHDYGTT